MLRSDIYINEVIARYDALKNANIIPSEPTMRPRAWLQNFDDEDKMLAAKLLERFVYYRQFLTDSLLKSSFNSIADGLEKGPKSATRELLLTSLPKAIFTPVSGETPNATDSGYFISRLIRQTLNIDEQKILLTADALEKAKTKTPIIFIDDFIGSGDQFLNTWNNTTNRVTFEQIYNNNNFTAIYICLVGTLEGIEKIHQQAPNVAICTAHKLDERATFWGLKESDPLLFKQLDLFLKKYSVRLRPRPADSYMNQSTFLIYGYKNKGLFFGFEHSIPDATLPIFWCQGVNNWEPLIERR